MLCRSFKSKVPCGLAREEQWRVCGVFIYYHSQVLLLLHYVFSQQAELAYDPSISIFNPYQSFHFDIQSIMGSGSSVEPGAAAGEAEWLERASGRGERKMRSDTNETTTGLEPMRLFGHAWSIHLLIVRWVIKDQWS